MPIPTDGCFSYLPSSSPLPCFEHTPKKFFLLGISVFHSLYKSSKVVIKKALLKLNGDFNPMVIGANTRDSCLEKRRSRSLRSAEEAPEPPAEIKRLEWKSTDEINLIQIKSLLIR
jgi:hypothetical protein